MTAAARGGSIIDRMMRAAMLDRNLYEEVERDTGATGQAAIVVVLSAIATGIAAFIRVRGDEDATLSGPAILVAALFGALVGWVVWSLVTYWVGKTFFKTAQTRVTPGEMLRTLGFSQSPGVLLVLTFIPILGALIGVGVGIWVFIAGVIAVRQAMDFSTGRAVGTVAVGWLIQAAIQLLLRIIF